MRIAPPQTGNADAKRQSSPHARCYGQPSGAAVTTAQAAEGEQPNSIGTVEHGKVTFPPQHDPETEAGGSIPNGDPLARRLGVAVVGIGHLTLEQILPGFAQAKSVRIVALVSGHRDKAFAVAAQYGVADQNIYDYGNFDAIRDNPAIEAVYIVLPNAMHEEFVTRAARTGKHVLCEKPMAINVAKEATQRATIAMSRSGQLGRWTSFYVTFRNTYYIMSHETCGPSSCATTSAQDRWLGHLPRHRQQVVSDRGRTGSTFPPCRLRRRFGAPRADLRLSVFAPALLPAEHRPAESAAARNPRVSGLVSRR